MPIFARSPAPSPSSWYRAPLLAGDQGTQQTIDVMRHLVDEASADQNFVNLAVKIVKTVPAYHDLSEVEALYNWVKHNIRFTKDPVTKEKLYPPQQLLKIKAGDCDDISMLLGAFLLALGYPARLITLAANPSQPTEFSHVYVEAEVPPGSGEWVPMDAARADSEFGVAPPTYFRKRAWSLTDNSYQDLSGASSFVHANTIRSLRGLGCGSDCVCGGGKKLSGLGEYVGDQFFLPAGSRLSGMGSYGAVRGRLGQTDTTLVSQALSEMPTIMSVAAGQPTYSTNPYGSFATSYTPGYGIPQAGYVTPGYPSVAASASASSPMLLIVGGVLLLMMLGGGRSPAKNPHRKNPHARYRSKGGRR